MQERFSIRTMTRKEVSLAIEWAAGEGWNPGLHDAACYHSADPNGFLLGLLDEEPVVTISAIRYGETFGFLGFYIVKPEHRGRGYGLRIWEAGLQFLEGRNVGLDGVVAQQDNYRRSGFQLAYRNIRHEGRTRGTSQQGDVIELAGFPFQAVAAYDRVFFPEDRTRFLESWIRQPGCRALGVLQEGRLSGYGVLRRCRSGYKIGPLFADSPDQAETLLVSLQAGIEAGEPLVLDTPEINEGALALAEQHGMRPVFETARMYKQEIPDLPLDRVFGVTSFEVG